MAVAIAATIPVVATGASAEELVSECHREVEGRVRLASDLLCPGGSTRGVALLLKRGRLYLDGHAIVHQPGAGKQNGIQCNRRCTIIGPGVISGFDLSAGITAIGAIRLENVSVIDNEADGVLGNRLVRIESSAIERNGHAGIFAHERVSLENTTVAENAGFGVLVLDSDFVRPHGTSKFTNAVVTGNGADGVYSRSRVRFRETNTVENNALDPASELCDPGLNGLPHAFGCADIQATSKSRVDGMLVCGTSLEFDTPNTLGICADD